jgi:hypothetical protein
MVVTEYFPRDTVSWHSSTIKTQKKQDELLELIIKTKIFHQERNGAMDLYVDGGVNSRPTLQRMLHCLLCSSTHHFRV